jgi:hypothetical protein
VGGGAWSAPVDMGDNVPVTGATFVTITFNTKIGHTLGTIWTVFWSGSAISVASSPEFRSARSIVAVLSVVCTRDAVFIHVTREHVPCSWLGACDQLTGICTCQSGYSGDCGSGYFLSGKRAVQIIVSVGLSGLACESTSAVVAEPDPIAYVHQTQVVLFVMALPPTDTGMNSRTVFVETSELVYRVHSKD